MKIPLHSILRKKAREYFLDLVAKLTKNSKTKDAIDKNEIKTIVIIRPNYRIGNIIFLTPLINELTKIIPNVKIDVIVGMKFAGKILEPMPSIDKVIDVPRKVLLHPLKLYRLINETRAKKYDLALNIASGSVSSELVTALINSKYKAAYKNNKTFIALTHSVEEKKLYKHAGSTPLELLKLFTNNLPVKNVELDIRLTNSEIKLAKTEFDNLLKRNCIHSNNKKIALFRNARFDKKISDDWWDECHKELLKIDKNITVIDILSPDIPLKLNKNCLEYSNKNLRLLGAFFYCCDLYISADTGPLHLSCASKAKTIALFNKTDISIYGTLGMKNKTIDINDMDVKKVAYTIYEHMNTKER